MTRLEPKYNLIQIQDALVATVNEALARWAHAKPAYPGAYRGHAGRSIRYAQQKARRALEAWGFTPADIAGIIRSAMEMAELERNAIEVEPAKTPQVQWQVAITDNGKPYATETFDKRSVAAAYAMRWNRNRGEETPRYRAEVVRVEVA